MNKKQMKKPSEIYRVTLVGEHPASREYFWKSIVRGLGGLTEVCTYVPAPKKLVSTRFPSVKAALRSDMVRIGNDMRIVIAREKAKNEAAIE